MSERRFITGAPDNDDDFESCGLNKPSAKPTAVTVKDALQKNQNTPKITGKDKGEVPAVKADSNNNHSYTCSKCSAPVTKRNTKQDQELKGILGSKSKSSDEEIFKNVKAKYLGQCNKINKMGYDVTEFNQQSQVAKENAKVLFENEYRRTHCGSCPPQKILHDLELCLNESRSGLTEFKTVDGDILEVSSSILKVSRELSFLKEITKSKRNGAGSAEIKEIRWIGASDIILDSNLSGEFWSGINLVFCTRHLSIGGSGARFIDVSGQNGESASRSPPLKSNVPGTAGHNGEDGKHGESGGNVAIIAATINNVQNLHIISNGGSGGDGQPGGNGASGKKGISGNDRFKMSIEDLKAMFPSPAKLSGHNRQKNLNQGYQSLKQLAGSIGSTIKTMEVCNGNSQCYLLDTAEGAIIQYGYFKGALGSSFYVWCQGAPGTNDQPGGLGGYGGRGGGGGKPGAIIISSTGSGLDSDSKKEVIDIGTTCNEGSPGINGNPGTEGKTVVSGTTYVKQGTDFAIVDPYAGTLGIFGGYKLKEFSGNLKMKQGRQQDDGTWKTFEDHAYCPFEKRYISFLPEDKQREVCKIYGEAEKPQPREQQKVQKMSTPMPKSIDIDEIKMKYNLKRQQ